MNPAAAANVGLRRAQGRFVSPKAADTYLSDEIVATIARRDLHENALYRCDRCDVALSARDLENLDDDSLLARLESLDSTRHSRMPHPPQWYIRDLHTNACGDFLLMSRTMWHTVRGFPLDNTVLSLDCDSLIMHAAAALGSHEICLPAACRIFKGRHARLFTQPHHPGLVALAVQGSTGSWPNSAGGGCRRSRRSLFDYPKRKVAGVESVLGPSIERNFVKPAEQWAHGTVPQLDAAGKLGTGRSAARGKDTLPGALGHGRRRSSRHERRAGRFPGRRPRQPAAGADGERAKPMLDVGGRPFLDYLLDEASRHGIKRALLLCGYRAGDLVASTTDATIRGMRIETVVEAEPGRHRRRAWRWRPTGSTTGFFLVNGDSLFDFNWLALCPAPRRRQHQAWVRMALASGVAGTRYGRVVVDGRAGADFIAGRARSTSRSMPASI